MEKVILVGGFSEIIELCEACGKTIVGVIDKNPNADFFGHELLGDDEDAHEIWKVYGEVPVVITPDSPQVRELLVKRYSGIGFSFSNLIHPNASISKYAKIGNGVIIQNMANISTSATIGDFVKINTCANIMHDAVIDSYSTIAPNALILGRVKINNSCHVGANANVLPGLEIGSMAVVGASAVVTKSVRAGVTVVGNPARELRRRKPSSSEQR